MKQKKKKHAILRVRKKSNTERSRLGTMVVADKKKAANKKKCRGKVNVDD
jgi:hypothetical protein